MQLRLRGKHLLDGNNYNRILIKGDSEEVDISVTGKKSKYKTDITTYKFSDSLTDRNPEEKICDIVDYFASYNRINYLKDNEYLPYQNGSFMFAKTTNEKSIAIKLPKNDKLMSIPSNLLNKYMFDRMRFCEENKDINLVEVHLNSSTSYKKEFIHGMPNPQIKFNLCVTNDNFKKVELEFLKDFILDRLYLQNEKAIMGDNIFPHKFTDNYVILGKYLKCGDFVLNSKSKSPNFEEYLSDIVKEYNNKLEESKKKQLKLEGF